MRDRQLHGSWEPAPSAEPEPVPAGAGIANPECIPAVNKTLSLRHDNQIGGFPAFGAQNCMGDLVPRGEQGSCHPLKHVVPTASKGLVLVSRTQMRATALSKVGSFFSPL